MLWIYLVQDEKYESQKNNDNNKNKNKIKK